MNRPTTRHPEGERVTPYRARHPLARYGFAVAATVLVTACRLVLGPILGPSAPLLPFTIAVMLAAWFGGLFAGLLSTLLSLALGLFLFILPAYPAAFTEPNRVVSLLIFLASGVIVSCLSGAMHAARRDAVAAAAKMAEYEGRLRLVFESVQDFSIFTTDLGGIVTGWNKGAENVFGYQESEILGHSADVVFTPEDRAEGIPRREMETAAREGRASDERWHLRKDGRRFFASGTVTPLADDDGTHVGFTKVCRDVTERHRAAEAIRLSEERATAVLESVTDAFFSVDRDWRVTYINRNGEAMLARTRGDLVGKHLWEEFAPAVGTAFHRNYTRVMEDRVTATFVEFYTPLGRWFEVHAYPASDGLAVYFRDVTAAKQAEDLRPVLAAIVESSEDAIIAEDLDGMITGWNRAAERIFGYAADEIIGGAASALAAPGHAEDPGAIMEVIRLGEKVERFETKRLAKDGRVLDISLTASPIRNGDGDIIGASKVARDITRRTQAERARRDGEALKAAILTAAMDCIVTIDSDGRVIEWNPAAEATFGYGRGEAIGGVLADLIIPPEYRSRHQQGLARYLESGEAVVLGTRIELMALRRDGSTFPIEASILPIRLESETLFTAYARDITERKRYEGERDQILADTEAARAEAEAANRMKDEFLTTLSHELRTPLNAILGWASILKSGRADPEDMEEGITSIVRNGQAQAQLIEDLLDVSRITSGNLKLDVQRLNPADVIEAALSAVMPAAAAKEIRVQKVLDSLAGPVSGDFARLQQVVWNLVANAVKFTPKGGKVQVLLERVNSHIEISVIDTGMGIKPEFLPHVFDRFRQSDSSTTRRHGGLGLGLAIVKQLVEMHGGGVRAKSPGEGQGSTFTVALPLPVIHPERPEPEKALPKPARAGEDICQAGALAGLRVLVVDDEPDARQLIRRVLADCEAEVATAASADEAWDRIATFRPDVLVSDIGMPDQDGYDLIRRVRSAYSARDLPAAALTAFARAEDRKRALLAGFQTHVAKPVDPAELAAVVASLAGRTGG